MRFVAFLMIVSVLLGQYLTEKYSLPRPVAWLPEMVSLLAAFIVIVR